MRKRFLNVYLFLAAVIFILLSYVLSCVSYSITDSDNVQKVDTKIINEFNEAVENVDFYDACKSYIEFSTCYSDYRTNEMIREIEDLYSTKISEFKDTNDLLSIIEYTYSLVNLAEKSIDDHNLSGYKKDLAKYVHRFVESELNNKGELEKVSWLIHLTELSPGDPDIHKLLVKLYLKRNNLFLAQKHFNIYSEIIQADKPSGYETEFEMLEAEINDLKLKDNNENKSPQEAIEDMIKSSVKIVVDKGIKTEGGVGTPDHLLGTGVVIDKRGYIITNYHIIESSVDPKYEGYSRVYVIPGKDENIRFVARIIGYDSVYDLALLKVEKRMESFIRFGDSDILRQGEKVVAIGNPIGLTNTVTSGVVSSIDRPFLQIGNIIQIDAALNPGNSGGALINSSGYLVGITFAGLENFENLNFAIPSNLLLSILFRLYEGGQVKRSWIGCAVEKQDDKLYIDYIVPEGPAGPARLQKGDIITEVNGKQTADIFDIQSSTSHLGNPLIISLTIERDKKVECKTILLEGRPELPALYVYDRDAHENIITPLFGIVMSRLDPPRKKNYLVTRVVTGSVASRVGISEGDIIKVKGIKYDEKYRVFYLPLDLKSKRFGYLNKSMVLYTYTEINTFI